MCMSHFSLLIDEVESGPVVVIIAIPESEVIIEENWVVDIVFLDGGIDIGSDFLIGEFWRVYTDDDESLIAILAIPGCNIWESTLTVDTAKRPEINEDDLTT